MVADAYRQAEAIASYVTDGPEQLLTAVANIARHETSTRAEFEAEPTVYRWFFLREHTDVGIRLVEAADHSAPDDAGTLIWTGHHTVDTLARAVVRAFDTVLADLGEETYEAQWGRPFPHLELAALRRAWRKE
jgi:hypothetical protein